MHLSADSDFSGNEDEDFYSMSPNDKPKSSTKKVSELQKIIT